MLDKYDIHTHILPQIDDGAKSTTESIEMLENLKSQGVNHVIFTPHYYSDRESIGSFINRRDEAFSLISDKIPEGMEVRLGSEVFVSEFLFNRTDLTPLCLSDKRYILLEFPYYSSFHERSLDQLRSIMYDYKVHPILAHVERYKNLLESQGAIERLIRLGCKLQVDLSALYNLSYSRKVYKLFDNKYISLVATDCHNMSSRAPEFLKGTRLLTSRYGRYSVEKLMENAKEIFD